MLDIFSSKNILLADGQVQVQVSTYNQKGDLKKNGDSVILELSVFERYQAQSRAVLKMIPDQNYHGEEEGENQRYRQGTAFHIGQNLVLTNHHVLSPTRKNLTECGDFQVENSEKETFSCKKVHFCSHKHDICLIEVKGIVKNDCLFCRGNPYTINLKEHLSLRPIQLIEYPELQTIVLSAIGNSLALGIHFSQGRGFQRVNNNFAFFAPIRKGNSGGPLLLEDGSVIGVVKLEKAEPYVSNDGFNFATPAFLVIDLVREALAHDPTTLEKFERAILP
jgi:S1-C subfamily serine protease